MAGMGAFWAFGAIKKLSMFRVEARPPQTVNAMKDRHECSRQDVTDRLNSFLGALSSNLLQIRTKSRSAFSPID